MKLVIDRIEEGWAICTLYDDERVQLDLPIEYLPAGVREGDHLDVTFEVDRESTEKEKKKAEELLKKLTKDQDPGQKKFKL
jgi:hypothetical protein